MAVREIAVEPAYRQPKPDGEQEDEGLGSAVPSRSSGWCRVLAVSLALWHSEGALKRSRQQTGEANIRNTRGSEPSHSGADLPVRLLPAKVKSERTWASTPQ